MVELLKIEGGFLNPRKPPPYAPGHLYNNLVQKGAQVTKPTVKNML